MSQGKQVWNKVAQQYQSTVFTKDESSYPDDLMEFLHSKGAVAAGERIADIGCGAGKYAIRFAEEGCDLLLIDIADQMLFYTKKNLESSRVKLEAAECDFTETDIDKMGWAKSVDLAFAAMTPAIETEQDIEKMSEMSRKHCFLSRFARMDNPVRKAVCDAFGVVLPAWGSDGISYIDLAGYVKKLGYLPELMYADYEWDNTMTIAETVERMQPGHGLPVEDTPENRQKALEAVTMLAGEDGIIHEHVKSKIVWLYWNVSD
ncbi:MAG: class I SAM-dependent methyltransferase [Oscillospiraceae bacterium]|nr:class I SAM-dependent methyltransferase [Oscillospiraceae bacterium]